jgi:hypothetical protein
MDELAIMRVSGVVVAVMYLLRWAGVPRGWAPLLVPVLSALGVGLWAYANAPLNQPVLFSYVAGWVAVATSAATAWGFSSAAMARLRCPSSGSRGRQRQAPARRGAVAVRAGERGASQSRERQAST